MVLEKSIFDEDELDLSKIRWTNHLCHFVKHLTKVLMLIHPMENIR